MRIDVKGTIVPNDDQWIYDLFEIEATSPKIVNDAIANANGDRLDVYINSGGGDVFSGSEIYSALREYSGTVKIHVVGIAASAASVIACAANCEMSPTAQIMVHNVSSCTNGDYHDMDKMSEILQKANETIAAAYVAKSGMSKQEALDLMDRETWLSAEDALKLGLVDEISGNKNMQLVAGIENIIPRSVIDKMNAERIREKSSAQERLNKLKGGTHND